MLLLFWCCGWSPRERECVCPRSARKKKNLEAPKDAKCPRRRCNLVSAVALFEGLSWLPRSVSTCGRKNAPDRRPRPRFPSVLARRSTPLALRQASATASALCVVLGLGARALLTSVLYGYICRERCERWMIIWAAVLGGDRICFLSSNVLEPPFGTPQHFRVLFTSCGS